VFFSTREAAGALGARHSLRPLISEGGTFKQTSGASRGEIAKVCAELEHRHCERSEAIHSCFLIASWIASRSLSSGAHSRDPLARNDDSRLFEI
jgi:hypothetical protein